MWKSITLQYVFLAITISDFINCLFNVTGQQEMSAPVSHFILFYHLSGPSGCSTAPHAPKTKMDAGIVKRCYPGMSPVSISRRRQQQSVAHNKKQKCSFLIYFACDLMTIKCRRYFKLLLFIDIIDLLGLSSLCMIRKKSF